MGDGLRPGAELQTRRGGGVCGPTPGPSQDSRPEDAVQPGGAFSDDMISEENLMRMWKFPQNASLGLVPWTSE